MVFSAGHDVTHLRAEALSFAYPDRPVLTDLTIVVDEAARVGLVGDNGVGKSTALRILAGLLEPGSGTVQRPARTTLVHQELPHHPGDSVGDVLDRAVADVRALGELLETLGEQLAGLDPADAAYAQVSHAYDQALTEATLADVWSVDARLAEVVAGVGLSDIALTRPVTQISGGQRHRLALASALLTRPTCLLLDEPTNHLDDAGSDFLAAHLREWPGPVLFASHDRSFLDRAATAIIDLDPAMGTYDAGADLPGQQGTVYSGSYLAYLAAKEEARARWEKQYADEQAERNRLRGETREDHAKVFHTDEAKGDTRGAKKFYADKAASTLGRRANSARLRLDALERRMVTKPPARLRLTGVVADDVMDAPSPVVTTMRRVDGVRSAPGAPRAEFAAPEPVRRTGSRSGHAPTRVHTEPIDEVVLAASDVSVAGRLAPVSFQLRRGNRVLVTGGNGAGKSTLLAVLEGTLGASGGEVLRRKGLTVGLLGQDVRWVRDDVPASQAYRELVASRVPDAEDDPPPLANWGLVTPRDLNRPVGSLSVGQQRRVVLAGLLATQPDVLMLDEPTNHLSLTLAEELEAALPTYPGAVVIASHDRWLRDRWDGDRLHLRRVP